MPIICDVTGVLEYKWEICDVGVRLVRVGVGAELKPDIRPEFAVGGYQGEKWGHPPDPA